MVCGHFKNLDAQNIELKNVAEQIYNAENCRSKRGSSSQEKMKTRHFVTIATSEIQSKSKGLPNARNEHFRVRMSQEVMEFNNNQWLFFVMF